MTRRHLKALNLTVLAAALVWHPVVALVMVGLGALSFVLGLLLMAVDEGARRRERIIPGHQRGRR